MTEIRARLRGRTSGTRAVGRRWLAPGRLLVLAALLVALTPMTLRALGQQEISFEHLVEVMPAADKFSERKGDPPVIRAFRTNQAGEPELIGFLFLTTEVPPPRIGYAAIIKVLVGMDLEGRLTGVKVLQHREPIASIIGDFFARPDFLAQFVGKSIADEFRVNRDIDRVSRATLSIRVMSEDVRDAARLVADTYVRPSVEKAAALEYYGGLTWPQLVEQGLIATIATGGDGMVGSEVSFALVGSDTLGRSLLGPATYLQLRAEADARADGYRLLLIGTGMPLDGTVVADRLSIRQNAISYGVSADIFIYLGESIAGVFGERVAYVGAVLVDPAVDFGRAATIRYDLRPDMDMYEIEMAPPPAAIVPPGEVGPAAPITAISKRLDQVRPSAAAEAEPPGPAATGHPGPSAPVLTAPTESTEAPIAPPSRIEPDLDFSAYEEATFRERMIESAVWPEIFTLIAVFTLSLLAFFSRNSRVRWIAPSAALVYVGFIDGSFLPVSHITGGVEVGPSFYVNDLKLLVVVGFAVVTVLLFGRLVCGNLCPFGTVQDLLQRFVPERFQYLPRSSIDARLRFAKYVFLALILLAAAAGSEMTLFQYFEPFGTLFFLQPLGILGLILLASLIASAIVPRFYCRYVCPLGAALGIGSLLALFRIKRVDACSSCHICEQSCPVGAISGPKISFTECLRCGVCEEKLMMRVGACRLTSGGPAPGQLKSRQPAVAK